MKFRERHIQPLTFIAQGEEVEIGMGEEEEQEEEEGGSEKQYAGGGRV